MRHILPWTVVAFSILSMSAPSVGLQTTEQDPERCGPALKKKERKQVTVVDARDLEREVAIQRAEEHAGKKIEVLFDELLELDHPTIEKRVRKEAAERGCWVAIITESVQRKTGQQPKRIHGPTVGSSTGGFSSAVATGERTGEEIYVYDTRVHFGRFVTP